jgi:gag-polypeptide of LTR copia-type
VLLEGTATTKEKRNIEIENYDAENETMIEKLLNLVSEIHKTIVIELSTSKEVFDLLPAQYTSKNKAGLKQLFREIFEVKDSIGMSVVEKATKLRNLNAEIRLQDEKQALCDAALVTLLCSSMDESFEGVIDIMNAKDTDITLEEAQRILCEKETALIDPVMAPDAAFSARSRGGSSAKGRSGRLPPIQCYHCGGLHPQRLCEKWLATDEGKAATKEMEDRKADREEFEAFRQWKASQQSDDLVLREKAHAIRVLEDSEDEQSV